MPNSFKTYWDLEEKERAALTDEEVERFVDAELMTKGVLKVAAPDLVPVPEVATKPSAYYTVQIVGRYGVSESLDVVFASREAAAASLTGAFSLDHDYQSDSRVARPIRPDAKVVEVEALPESVHVEHKATLERVKAAKEANAKAQQEYQEASRKQSQALQGLWDDWHRCRGLDRQHRKVVATFEEYVRVAQGGEQPASVAQLGRSAEEARTIAGRFLLKVFTREEIAAAGEWCGVEIPVPGDVAEAPRAEAPQSTAADAIPC